ncbi:HD domain-containing protein [Planctomicrobium sp. SH664]|uniref:HD domain-containing protein n=1 Tax=Planctomicrobium sp. SH664 TaxID=3448125 RepID=UPI003F5C08EC
MSAKIFRDPLYNYVGLSLPREKWLLELLDTPEVQRLRRIHQLGVSSFTYPGADHSRLSHSLGVVHLMQQAVTHLESLSQELHVTHARGPLLAAALLHDVGHGPFSHLFEPCLGIKHETWSLAIIQCEDKDLQVNRILKSVYPGLPGEVAALIEKNNYSQPPWMKYLLDSQLDVDRLDYLRRDSLFTGAGYGHYDHYRILTSFEFHEEDGDKHIVWNEKAMLAIEEYIFSRYYMYQNVYLHKTTRGFEKMLEAMWTRAKSLRDQGDNVALVPAIESFWNTKTPSPQQYLRIEEFTVLQQIEQWKDHTDPALSDLAHRFLARKRFSKIEPPRLDPLTPDYESWEAALRELVSKRSEYTQADAYVLKDEVSSKYMQPYFPEKETDEQSVKTSIRILANGRPVEISTLLDRLKPVTQKPAPMVRYYIPTDLMAEAARLRESWNKAQ